MGQITVGDLLRASTEYLGVKNVFGKRGFDTVIGTSAVQRFVSGEILKTGIPLIVNPSQLASILCGGLGESDFASVGYLSLDNPFIIASNSESITPSVPIVIDKCRLPVLTSAYDEFLLESRLKSVLREKIDGIVQIQGVLVDISGVGVMIVGESGVGKTSCARRLIESGNRLVADDLIIVEKKDDGVLYGRSPIAIKGLLEIKGEGIVRAEERFGPASVSDEAPIRLVVELINHPVAISKKSLNIMGINLPLIILAAASCHKVS